MATPIEAATRRLGSLVDDSAMTAKTTWPGFMRDRPSSRSTSSQWGGKIELTRTRLKFARWASRRPPFAPLPLPGAEQIDRLDLGGRHVAGDGFGQLRPARPAAGR